MRRRTYSGLLARALPAVLLLSILVTPAAAAQPVLLPEAPVAEEPCLPGDPYELAQLAAVLSSDTPPSAPVTIGRNIVVQYVRKANMIAGLEDRVDMEQPPGGVKEPREIETPDMPLDGAPLRVFNSRTQFEFRLTMTDAMLKDIHNCREAAGMTDGGGPWTPGQIEGQYPTYLPQVVGPRSSAASVFAALAPEGWSNHDDSRVLRTPTTAWPWRTITQVSNADDSRCTMTLVGPRHMVTAAHCIIGFGTSNWYSWTLTPARDGKDTKPYGTTSITPTPPAGKEAWYFVPDPWMDPNTTNKYQWDVGAIVVLDRIGEQTGWMGYGAWGASDLNTRDHWNRGYPSCQSDYVEKPKDCQTARLYGDTKECVIGDYYNPGSNGWNRNISFSCDISRGHSGSALYHYRFDPQLGKTVPVVIAVVSWHECFTCSTGDDFPNHARRFTPWVRDVISWLREEFP